MHVLRLAVVLLVEEARDRRQVAVEEVALDLEFFGVEGGVSLEAGSVVAVELTKSVSRPTSTTDSGLSETSEGA